MKTMVALGLGLVMLSLLLVVALRRAGASPKASFAFIDSVVRTRAYGITVTLVNVALFSTLEVPEATARPT